MWGVGESKMSDKKEYYAHIYGDKKEPLINHLNEVAELAEKYAEEFGSGKIGRQLGLLHDVGKRSERFQKVLRREEVKIDHAIVGAIYYYNQKGYVKSSFMKRIISGIIAAHHSLLICDKYDYAEISDYSDSSEIYTKDSYKKISISSIEEYKELCEYINENNLLIDIKQDDYLNIKEMTINEKELYVRMLFSCLVDADYTKTASFRDGDYEIKYEGEELIANKLIDNLKAYRQNIIDNSNQELLLNKLRNVVYEDCSIAGKEKNDGLYTLTAPTGTAKTLALLKFALEKAKVMNKKRIFIVLPYLSIISQNVKIYKEICGEEIVLEDDSLTVLTDETKEFADKWSAPVIVTTSVKFFKTLFSSKAPSLRKLHNIVNSVVVFDECQTLPSNVLGCTIEIMNSLSKFYKTTVLFSTATLPSYQYRKDISELGCWKPKEVIRDVKKLYEQYGKGKKIIEEYDVDNIYNSDMLINKTEGMNEVLYVFNTVKKASDMYDALCENFKEEDCYLLSSNMCSQHKLDIIKEIKSKLINKKKCFVSSTQCIEAGVDLDFPVGIREFAPYDSEVQTAGRVNRNGVGEGYILYYMHENSSRYDYPSAYYFNASNVSKHLAENMGGNISKLIQMDKYYKQLYSSVSQCINDDEHLKEAIEKQNYEEIDNCFNLIDDTNQLNVIVPYKELMDEYERIADEIHSNDNCITKKIMKETTLIRIMTYKRDAVERCCEKLYLRTSKGKFETNWYLLSDKSKYTKKGIDFSEGGNSICL